jgi:hypothetical protein
MSTERGVEDIQQRADAAVFDAQRHLDSETEQIRYDGFTPEKIAELESGPGRVQSPVEQRRPIQTSPHLFMRMRIQGKKLNC